jgi:pimeloyl-ACP methyl ester carboxylesterase
MTTPLAPNALPAGIRSRFLPGINGLSMHVLEAGFETPGRPLLLLLHGFPELAYSWRKVMLPLAAAGYHVVAPDQRGYGRTTGWVNAFDTDLRPFAFPNLVRDALGLVWALGHTSVEAVIGHDFGSPVAAWCALIRPDVFRRVVMMSAPFAGPPGLPTQTAFNVAAVLQDLAKLPRPRKHYLWYYSTPQANANMQHCPQGVHAFMRAYYHMKSADWKANQPHPLAAWSADEMAKLPTYYVMDAGQGMAETVAPEMPSAAAIASCHWLPETELAVYAEEYGRTGFQGGLNWYRCVTSGQFTADMQLWAGRTIDVPAMYVAGQSDWGIYQMPGDFEAMQSRACTRFAGAHLLDGAGHWVQQEQPEPTCRVLLDFLGRADGTFKRP